ncbi:MAG: lasso peptide biosynthesis B2 protein [Vicinamibacterales bacterium]
MTRTILRHWRLLTVVTVAQCVIAAVLRVVSIAKVRAGAQACRPLACRLVPASDDRIAWALEATGRRLGGASSCLGRALLAQMLLSRGDAPVSVCLGVKHPAGGALQAHAWAVRGDRILVGAPAHEYLPMLTWTAVDAR